MSTAAIPILLALLATAYLALTILSRPTALALFCALLPVYVIRFKIPVPFMGDFAIPSTFLEVMFIILFVVWLMYEGRTSEIWQKMKPWYPPLLLFFLGASFGALISPDWLAGLGLWRAYFVEPILFFFLFADIVNSPERRNMVIWSLGAALAVIGISAIYQKFTGFGIPNPYWQAEETRRATSFFGFPNAIGLFSAPVIVLMAGRAVSRLRSRDPKLAMYGALAATVAVIGTLGVLYAVSEGAIIATIAGLVLLGLLMKKLRGAALGLIIIGCLTVMFYGPALHYVSKVTSFSDDSGSVRLIVWQESLNMLSEHLVFGAGLSGYQQVLEPYHQAKHIEIFMYPHNFLLNFWSETGLIGLAGFLWILCLFFREAWELRRHRGDWLHLAVTAAMGAILVHGLVDVPYFKNDLAFLFFIIVGLAVSMELYPRKAKIRYLRG